MRFFRKAISALVTFAYVSGLALPAKAGSIEPASGAMALPKFGRFKVADVPRSRFYSVRDLGRRMPAAQVTAAVTLRYNHQAELDALVRAQSDRSSPLFHRFLTSAQFNGYFALTPQQQGTVIAALRSAGVRVVREYPNRTLLDVAGTSAAVERFFATEMHSFVQGRYGERFANATPATIPASLAPLISAVSLSNLIVARTGPRAAASYQKTAASSAVTQAAESPTRTAPAIGRFRIAPAVRPELTPDGTNRIADPGFESGNFGHGWDQCETLLARPLATITSSLANTGKYSAHAGATSYMSRGQFGYAGVCQLVKVPTAGVLSAYLYQLSNEPNTKYAAQDVFLLDTSGTIVATLAQSVTNRAAWALHSWNLARFAGRRLYVYFGVHGDGYAHDDTMQYVDDVNLTAGNPACNAAPENGPFTAGGGHVATGVADAFDFPVQHGCNGAGETVAVEISSPVEQTDIDAYLAAAGVAATGTITNVPVDGGGTYGGIGSGDSLEATLDVETISGLAPGANILVYNFPELVDQDIDDAYNQTVSDDLVSVTNSSFGGCEMDDTSGASTTNAIAEQGAAKGITFVAGSGDSGSDGCGTGNDPPAVVSPADDPFFVAVGGVDFTESSAGVLTSITSAMDVILSGGGVSNYFALPSYQAGIANVVTSGRNIPDISLPAIDVPIYISGTSVVGYGTSWSGPEMVALLSEANELHASTGFGWINPTMYGLFKSSSYADFTDVTSGNNGSYSALTGYDQVTGIGAPKGYAFAIEI